MKCEEGSGYRRHAASRDQRRLGLFQRGNSLAENLMVWAVAQAEIAHIVIPLAVVLETARLKDGRGDGALDAGSR